MKNFNFYCIDCDCKNKDLSHKERTFVIPMTEEEKEGGDVICHNSEKSILKCQGYIPTWGIGKFNSLTPDQKQQVLLKRSKEHFKKNITEDKYEKNKSLIKKFKAE